MELSVEAQNIIYIIHYDIQNRKHNKKLRNYKVLSFQAFSKNNSFNKNKFTFTIYNVQITFCTNLNMNFV